jgi:pimeloyl-ACP methyl ester carboxylesterase
LGWSRSNAVLLAQLGNTAHEYDEWAPRLPREFRVVGITRRGSGVSDSSSNGYSIRQLAADIESVMSALDLQRAILVGTGLAGDEMSWVAAHHSPRLAGLVYLDAAYGRNQGDASITRRIPVSPPAPESLASVAALRAWMLERAGVAEPESGAHAERQGR